MQKYDSFADDQEIHEINENNLNGRTMTGDNPEEWTGHRVQDPPGSSRPHLCISEKYGVLTISVSVAEPDQDETEGRF